MKATRGQADAGRVRALLGGLVLELGHAHGLAHAGHAGQHPRQLRVLGHLGLDEQRGALGVDAAGDELRGGHPRALRERGRVLRHGDGVQVGDEEERLEVGLGALPVHEGAEVVAQVEGVRRGLHAGEHAVPGGRAGQVGGGGGVLGQDVLDGVLLHGHLSLGSLLHGQNW